MNLVRDGGSSSMPMDEDAPSGGNGGSSLDRATDYMSQLEVWFMAFDILYDGDHSVIDRPLSERQAILKEAVMPLPESAPSVTMTPKGALEPVCGAIKLLLPGSPWSRPVTDADAVQAMMREAVDRNEEGIIFKDLNSQWQKGDRSTAWMKLKPDNLPTGDLVRHVGCQAAVLMCTRAADCDLRACLCAAQDLLIIGAYRGTGKRGGEVRAASAHLRCAEPCGDGAALTRVCIRGVLMQQISQFLMGFAEEPRGGGEPSVFRSFCKARVRPHGLPSACAWHASALTHGCGMSPLSCCCTPTSLCCLARRLASA
jgi:hypothetical protein